MAVSTLASKPVRTANKFTGNRRALANVYKAAGAEGLRNYQRAVPSPKSPSFNKTAKPIPKDLTGAAQRRSTKAIAKPSNSIRGKKFKGKYAGPDKYKGIIPPHLKHKYKGKYFGRERFKGAANPWDR